MLTASFESANRQTRQKSGEAIPRSAAARPIQRLQKSVARYVQLESGRPVMRVGSRQRCEQAILTQIHTTCF